MKFRLFAAVLSAALLPVLSGCGGSSSDNGSGNVRLVNATTDYAGLDFYSTDTLLTSNTASFGVGTYVALGNGSYTFNIKRSGLTTTALSTARSVSSGVNNTLVTYSTANSLRSVYMTDSEAAPTSGYAKLRVFNTSYEAGSVDVYVASAGTGIDDLSPFATGVGAEHFSSYSEVGKGNYHIVVTGTGDKTDIRLDLPSIALADQQIATLILTTTPGGVLEHGLLVNQGGTATAQLNSSARLRLVADTTASGIVSATVNGVSLSSGLKSPTVGSYVMVPAGPITSTITVNNVAVPTSGLTAAAGADLTLMVMGTPAAPQVTLLSDDNRPPTVSTNVKLRLVNGLNNLNGTVTLTADYGAVTNDLGFATASTPASVIADTSYRLEVTSAASTAELYLATDVTLQATHVYTVFMLGDAAGTPLGVLRRDR